MPILAVRVVEIDAVILKEINRENKRHPIVRGVSSLLEKIAGRM